LGRKTPLEDGEKAKKAMKESTRHAAGESKRGILSALVRQVAQQEIRTDWMLRGSFLNTAARVKVRELEKVTLFLGSA